MFDREELVRACMQGDVSACTLMSKFSGVEVLTYAFIGAVAVLVVPEVWDRLKDWLSDRRDARRTKR